MTHLSLYLSAPDALVLAAALIVVAGFTWLVVAALRGARILVDELEAERGDDA